MARRFKRLTYGAVLRLFRRGVYRLEDGAVINASGRKIQVYTCHRGYRWVRLYNKGRRRAVPLHRIVWMLAHDRVVPRGKIVHHVNGKSAERPEDLQAITKSEHKAIHRQRDWRDRARRKRPGAQVRTD